MEMEMETKENIWAVFRLIFGWIKISNEKCMKAIEIYKFLICSKNIS